MPNSQYSIDLAKNSANYTALSPLTFIERAASVYPENCALIYNDQRQSWLDTYRRCCRFASALQQHGVATDDTVALMLPNVPAMYEANFAIPMAGAVIHSLNIRLDADAIAFQLKHGGATVLLTDPEFSAVVSAALEQLDEPPLVVDVPDPAVEDGELLGEITYEDFLSTGDPEFSWLLPSDEWQAVALGYTSGTTGNPKGVVTHHRGAYLNAVSNILSWNMNTHPVYLWTLPMFHCNGWCFPWTIAALNGTNVCLRNVSDTAIFDAIRRYKVTHMCGAPIVLNLMANASQKLKGGIENRVNIMTAASAPPPAVLESMAKLNFNVTHTYGLTEVYGPAVVCSWHEEWDQLPVNTQAKLKARQGVRYPMLEELIVADPDTLEPVKKDGQTIGEVMFRGNIVMKGYLKNPTATSDAFAGGYFHSGDLAVWHPDGYIEIKDRSKDVIISGGENISSIEVEATLYHHPAVLEAAVTAMPDKKWGETPCAFVDLHADTDGVTEEEIIKFCRDNMARYKAPRKVVFGPLPKTSTGKILKFELRDRAKRL
ncbi:MAG: acyl-CoA synthetase [Woeseia sp.]|nr:acyl-CoA synthetase [Woeseia sp.]